MNSGELASIAGVTVRTLRHYHQVGVLPEPVRTANGYRNYGVRDLITLLQVKRLAALGVPLEQIPAALDSAEGGHSALLDNLDRELEAQIDRLTAQRALVAQLRSTSAAPDLPLDLPPELGPFLAQWARANPSPELAKIDRDQSILLAHLAGAEGMPHLVSMFERMTDPTFLADMARLVGRFEALGAVDDAGAGDPAPVRESKTVRARDARIAAPRAADGGDARDARIAAPRAADGGDERDARIAAPRAADGSDERDATIAALVEEFVAVIAPVVRDIREAGSPLDFSASSALFTEHAEQTLTVSQRRILAGIDEKLEEWLGEHGDGSGGSAR
jgi:DNA-binding transcriptional MerR regulator